MINDNVDTQRKRYFVNYVDTRIIKKDTCVVTLLSKAK